MKLKLVLLVLVGLMTLGLLPVSARAADGPAVLSSSAEAAFPNSIKFNISASSGADINDIRLHYRVERLGFAEVTSEVYLDFTPGTQIRTNWDWDMKKTGGLPPGGIVDYWWTVRDASGGKAETQPARLRFDDRRYNWRNINQGLVTLHWYQGDDTFGRTLMAAAQDALARLTRDSASRIEKPMNIYIYANPRDLQGSMIFPQEWTGGVAYTEYGVIAIGIAQNQLDWGIRTITHEFTHLVVHQLTFNPYNNLPTWLDEGMAMYNEGSLDSSFAAMLNNTATAGRLITVRSLASPFSAFAQEASLAYAESYSIVKFLTETYGQAKMSQLLETFRQGSGYDEALLKVYGFDVDELNTRWRTYVTATPQPAGAR